MDLLFGSSGAYGSKEPPWNKMKHSRLYSGFALDVSRVFPETLQCKWALRLQASVAAVSFL